MDWNFGDLFDGCAEVLPGDAPAVIQGDRMLTWAEFGRRTNNLAARLRGLGARPDDKVAIYLRNCAEYVEVVGACFKARLVQVNVNFRYLDEELYYVLENSDAKFVVFGSEFAEHVAHLHDRLPGVQWIQVGGDTVDFAIDLERLAVTGDGAPPDIERSEDDLLFVYTGGTTGMPKAVMWRQGDLWAALGGGTNVPANRREKPASPEQHVENVRRYGPGPRQITACPLMHGTGLFTTIGNLAGGGCAVLLEKPSFDAEELWETVQSVRANSAIIVGDAFAKPMLDALEANPERWDLSSLRILISSGVMWSREVKLGLLRHHPDMSLADMFGSSEAIGFGTSITSARGDSRTATFRIGPSCKVFTEDHREVKPGSGERGFVARSGPIPLGYYKDLEKTARTFPTINGVRYSIPGDWCTVEADGTLNLLGRGSACINTAGEKVYPEEVEEALKTHVSVVDALVFGVEDDKWGQAVTAVVSLAPGAGFDEAKLRECVRASLAGYKTPKRIYPVEKMFRAPNGKADYKAAADYVGSL
jgi:acyl-CoA synthetase (AMP-forming)/AMP-acid ligase II